MHADEHPGPGLPVDVDGNGLAVPPGDQLLHSAGVYVGWLRSVRTGRGARTLAAPVAVGCSTTASTRGAMNLAVRTTPPVRVISRTSTVVRELRTSTVRPALVASTMYSRAAPDPASTNTSTKSPLAMPFLCPDLGLFMRLGCCVSPSPRPSPAKRERGTLVP